METCSDSFYGKMHQIILDVNSSEEVLLVVSDISVLGNDKNAARTGAYTVDYKSFFPFATKMVLLPREDSNLLSELHSALKTSLPQKVCLFPNWEIVRDGDLLEHPLTQLSKGRLSYADILLYESLNLLGDLNDDAQLLVMMPTNILTDHAQSTFRDILISKHTPQWIIEGSNHHNVFPYIHPAFRFCSLVIKIGGNRQDLVRCLQLPDALLQDKMSTCSGFELTKTGQTILSEIERLKKQHGGYTEHGYVLRGSLPKHSQWGVELNHPKWALEIEDWASLGSTIPLGEIAEILTGRPVRAHMQQELPVEGAILVSGRMIAPDGGLDLSPYDRSEARREVHTGDLRLDTGDLIMRKIHNPTNRLVFPNRGIPTAIIPVDIDQDIYVDNSVNVIRLKQNIPLGYRDVLLDFLNSPRCANWLEVHNGGLHIYPTILTQLPVPRLDDDSLALWNESTSLLEKFDEWRTELNDARKRLFRQKTVKQGREELAGTVLEMTQRVQAAKAINTFDWKVRNLYPYPLAYRWRLVASIEPPQDKYRAALMTTEFLITYLAIVSIVLYEHITGKSVGYIKTISDRLKDRPKAGMNFGDWIAILKQVSESKQLRNIGSGTPFYEVVSFYRDDNKDILEKLKNWRDDYSHFRDDELHSRLQDVQEKLRILVNSAEFLTKYPLREVVETQPIIRQEQTKFKYRDLMGDSELALIQQDVLESLQPLQPQALYLVSPSGEMFLVHPWMVRTICPVCNNSEIYCFDQLDESTKEIVIKSLEKGHSLKAEHLRSDLIAIGLVPE